MNCKNIPVKFMVKTGSCGWQKFTVQNMVIMFQVLQDGIWIFLTIYNCIFH